MSNVNTVRVHKTARAAAKDMDAHPMKSVWHNRKAHLFAVGDWSDLPTDVPGLWHELSAREIDNLAVLIP